MNPDLERIAMREEDMRFLYIRKCVNPAKSNIAIRVSASVYRWCIDQGMVNLGYMRFHCKEANSILQSFRCNGFGHRAVACGVKTPRCFRCGRDHTAKLCEATTLDCTHSFATGLATTALAYVFLACGCVVEPPNLDFLGAGVGLGLVAGAFWDVAAAATMSEAGCGTANTSFRLATPFW